MDPSVLESQSYGTPPELAPQVSAAQRAAIEGDVRAHVRLFTSGIAALVSTAFGAVGGAIWGNLSGSAVWTKTIGSGVVAGLVGLALNNATWVQPMGRHLEVGAEGPRPHVEKPEQLGTVADSTLQR